MAVPEPASDLKEPRVMTRNTLRYGTLLVCGVLALAGRQAPADDGKSGKDNPTLSGTWEKKDAEPKLEFTAEGKLTISPHGDNLDFQIECSYEVTKEGLVKAKITRLTGREDVIEKAKGAVPVGLEFRFQWKVQEDAATLDALEGNDVEHVKSRLEGGYTKKS
jgi:hypothetical protein